MHIVGLDILDRPFIGIYRKVNIWNCRISGGKVSKPGGVANESARTDGDGRCVRQKGVFLYVCRGPSVTDYCLEIKKSSLCDSNMEVCH